MTDILVPGLSCAEVFPDTRSGVLVDGRDFYKAVYDACCKAKKTIAMAGWQFASKVELLRGDDAKNCEHPTRLVDFLRELCEANPELNVYLLAWDASAVFTFEREPLQRFWFRVKGHDRIHYKMDNRHPRGASHHQKLIIVDNAIAFVGGMDVCNSRWDDRHHAAECAERDGARRSSPYHDVQAYVTGEPVEVLRKWFCVRWEKATGHELVLPEVPREEIHVQSSFDVQAPRIGLTRTLPRMKDPPHAPVREIYELHMRAIAAAERVIYLENQYLSSDEIADALERRMVARPDLPLEIAIVLPSKSAGFKERISIGIYQQRVLEHIGKVAEATGHHVGVYYNCACNEKGEEIPVFIHAKVLAVDDRFLLVSSANTSNRSMGFDTELGIAWEAPTPTESLRNARIDLMAEQCGLAEGERDAILGDPVGLVARLDELARSKSHRLRIHNRNVDEKPGRILRALLPAKTPFDPDDPQSFEEALPEPAAVLDKIFREPLMLVKQGMRRLSKKNRKQLKAG